MNPIGQAAGLAFKLTNQILLLEPDLTFHSFFDTMFVSVIKNFEQIVNLIMLNKTWRPSQLFLLLPIGKPWNRPNQKEQ